MNKLILTMQGVLLVLLLVFAVVLSREVSDVRATLEERVPVAGANTGETAVDPAVDLGPVRRQIAALDQKTQEILDTFEWLAIDIDGIKRNTWETLQVLQASGEGPEPEMPDDYRKLFEPETRAALVALAAEKGVVLKEDRVEVPGVIIQNQVIIELLAVIAGGKEHEAIVALTGAGPTEGQRMVDGLAGVLNACLLAIGFERGTPVQMSRDGKVLPAAGMTIRIYVEWKDPETGEDVRARAEDLVFNLDNRKPMARDPWVYIGSRFERNFVNGEVAYLADITGDIVATYSWPNTVIDNTTPEGIDDGLYAAYTPRIPPIGTKVRMVFSKEKLPAKEFPEEEASGDGKSDK